MKVLNGSHLAIGKLPMFRYNPEWSCASGWSEGVVERVEGRRLYISVDPSRAHVPSQSFLTTFINALWPVPVPAFPPGLSIRMETHQLKVGTTGHAPLGLGQMADRAAE